MADEKKPAKPKPRVTYSKEMRAEAKANQQGLVTIQIEAPNGDRQEFQAPADPDMVKFVRWLGFVAVEADARPLRLPDIEEWVRRHLGV